MKYLIIISTMIVLLSCCKVAEDLTIQKMTYNGSNLRVDGYYFHQIGEIFHPFVLFKDGVYMSCGYVGDINNINQIDSLIQDEEFIERLKMTQYGWGIFQVEGNLIKIERWLPGIGRPYPTQLLEGEIVNDSTILISGLRGIKYDDEIDEFKFRHLSPKPDSTNVFIK